MKKILFVIDFFVPHFAPSGQLIHELCVAMTDKFQVDVLAMNAESKRILTKLYDVEKFDGLSVYRMRTKSFNKKSKLSRIRHELEYFFKAMLIMLRLKHYDIGFFITQPPILGGVLGVIFKLFKRGKFIYTIEDFNPEQTEAVGYIKSSFLMNLSRKVDNFSLKRANRVVLVGRDMYQTLKKRGLKIENKCTFINNWADDEKIKPLSNEEVTAFRKEIAGDSEKVVMYSGNVGLYYDLENIIKVMGKFRGRKDIVFVFLGEGAKKAELEDYVKSENIQNIKFFPHQPKEKLPITLNAADIHLVCSQKGIKGVSVPSKLYGVMAAGKAVLGVVEKESEPWYLLKESGCGDMAEPQEYEKLEHLFEVMLNEPLNNIQKLGLSGREYLDKYLKKEKAMEKYRILFDVITTK